MSVSEYIKETRMEMKHVSWPTRRQAFGYTAIVVGVSLLIAAYLGLLDYVFATLLGKFVV